MSDWVSSKQKHSGTSQAWTPKINIFKGSSEVDFSELFAWAKGMLSHWGLFSLFRNLIMWFKIAFKRWPIWHSIFFHQQHVQKCCASLDLLVQIDEWEICCTVISCILLDRKQLFKNSKRFRLVKNKVRQNRITFPPIWICWAERVSTFSAARKQWLSPSYLEYVGLLTCSYYGFCLLIINPEQIHKGFNLAFCNVWVLCTVLKWTVLLLKKQLIIYASRLAIVSPYLKDSFNYGLGS